MTRASAGVGASVAASFAVGAGFCRPDELLLTPPPEPSETAAPPASDAVEVFQIGGPKPRKPDPKKKKR